MSGGIGCLRETDAARDEASLLPCRVQQASSSGQKLHCEVTGGSIGDLTHTHKHAHKRTQLPLLRTRKHTRIHTHTRACTCMQSFWTCVSTGAATRFRSPWLQRLDPTEGGGGEPPTEPWLCLWLYPLVHTLCTSTTPAASHHRSQRRRAFSSVCIQHLLCRDAGGGCVCVWGGESRI